MTEEQFNYTTESSLPPLFGNYADEDWRMGVIEGLRLPEMDAECAQLAADYLEAKDQLAAWVMVLRDAKRSLSEAEMVARDALGFSAWKEMYADEGAKNAEDRKRVVRRLVTSSPDWKQADVAHRQAETEMEAAKSAEVSLERALKTMTARLNWREAMLIFLASVKAKDPDEISL